MKEDRAVEGKPAHLKGDRLVEGKPAHLKGGCSDEGRPAQLLACHLQVAVGGLLLWLHSVMLRRLWHLYSPEAVLLSPGFGWSAPLAAAGLLLGMQRRRRAAAAKDD